MAEQHRHLSAAAPLDWSHAVGRFIWALPVWLAANGVVRTGELLGGGALGERLLLRAAAWDAIDFLRWLPLLFLSAWPLLRRPRPWTLALLWSVLLLAQLGLSGYFLVARTPLGSDLFGYSLQEIIETVRAANVSIGAFPLVAGVLALAVVWAGLWMAWRLPLRWSWRAAWWVPVLAGAAWLLPLQGAWQQSLDWDSRLRAQNKAGFFLESLLHSWQPASPPPVAAAQTSGSSPAATASMPSVDPAYPFMRPDRRADVLGAHFSAARRAPTLVFIVVEGLGRDFSGPNARLGSFTPFLDELSDRSLYFEHFIAPQGRTFGMLPSLFGSLPFGKSGFADLGDKMPEHADLFSILKRNGYDTRFYSGTNLDFDNERAYLVRQGVTKLRDLPWWQRQHALPAGSNSWGFADADLLRMVLAEEAREPDAPAVVAVQTITMHTDYHFPGQQRYRERVLERLRELHIPESHWQYYRDNLDIFSAILYADDAIRHFMQGMQNLPGHGDTVYILTGDHRLPELPMVDVLERHHVPLLIHSPLLKQATHIRSVSSHLDITPSLLAWLAHAYGVLTPEKTAWLGNGLDMFAEYRNLQDIPIKPVKGELPGMLSGNWYLLRGQLYSVSPQLAAEAASDPAAQAHVQSRLATFNANSQQMMTSARLLPPGAVHQFVAWDAQQRNLPPTAIASTQAPAHLQVRDVQRTQEQIHATLVNAGGHSSQPFIALLVVTDASGRELGETASTALQLGAGEARSIALALPSHLLGDGRYLSIIPADPNSGKRLGDGVFHLSLGTP